MHEPNEPTQAGEPAAGAVPPGEDVSDEPLHLDLDRRDFVKELSAMAVGLALMLVPVATGIYFIFEPLRRRREGGAPFVEVATLEAVPADGLPRAFRVVADRRDTWTYEPAVPVGAVYLRRTAEKPDEVIAFNTICPHLGCYVNSKVDGSYHCPCHNSEFNADGSRGAVCVSPRGLDELATKIEGDKILVQFQNFQTGHTEQVPVL